MPTGQPGGARVIWDDTAEKHLLLLILAQANPTALKWDVIAERFGHGLTAGGASQKYGKIKKRDKDIFDGNGATSTASTPRAAKKTSAVSTPKSTGKRNRKMVSYNEDDDDDHEEEPGKPTKKQRSVEKKEEEEEKQEEPDDATPVPNSFDEEYNLIKDEAALYGV